MKLTLSRGLRRYLRAMDEVTGWFGEPSPQVLVMLDYFQKLNGIKGDIFEIGVYHGKSAILLSQLVDFRQGEKLLLNDLFSYAPDDEEKFRANWQKFAHPLVRVTVIKKDSKSLKVGDTGKHCRIFHVDGNHSISFVLHDLQTALRGLHPKGFIAVDDALSHRDPEVSEGLFRFLRKRPDLRPFLLEWKKAYLVRKEHLSFYRKMIRLPEFQRFIHSRLPKYEVLERRYWGVPIDVVSLKREYWRGR